MNAKMLLVWMIAGLPLSVLGQETTAGKSPASTMQRVPWTKSRFQGTPEPPPPYIARRVFSELNFKDPVDWAVEPGSGRIYVLELAGKLFRFDPNQESPRAELVNDMALHCPQHHHSYGIEFDPDFANNRIVYLCYVLPPDDPRGSRLSRFQVTRTDPPQVDPGTEEIVLTWTSGGHNGGCLKFGPDGYLYVTTGDGTGPFPPDTAAAGQNMADLRSKILRIDVHHQEAERLYAIPADNPYVSLPDARPEIWAYGFRNPWKISFSPLTGELWCGDVGWELWELVFRVEKGGNYGWSVMEGRQPVRADVQRGPTPILPPFVDHKHTEARSITGGFVYTGTRLPGLRGAYIYGDWSTGKIWALRNNGPQLLSLQEIADTPLAIITFGLDPSGELYVVDYAGGIYVLEPNPALDRPLTFPRLLSHSGLYSSLESMAPESGVLPFELNAEMFMDGARAERVIGLPGDTSIEIGRSHDLWKFPEGTVAAKTISANVVDPQSSTEATWRRIETQVMHFDGTEWRAYTYAWNADQTDAELVPPEGYETKLTVQGDPSWLTDALGRREIPWRFHSRAECLTCHMPQPNVLLGFEPANLNRTAGGRNSQQLDEFVAWSVFDKEVLPEIRKRQIVDPYDAQQKIEARARSYLAVNCACCHRRQGGGTAHIEFPIENALERTHTIDALPTQGTFNIPQARIVAPGAPNRSVLTYRLSTVGRGHMPHIGPRNVDEAGLTLIREWIGSMSRSSAADEEVEKPARAVQKDATDMAAVLASTPQSMQLAADIAAGQWQGLPGESLIMSAIQESQPHIRGLFERFIPENERRPVLGMTIDPRSILALPGDATRGRELFLQAEGVACRNCHQLEGQGKNVGPDLSKTLNEQTREQILESILDPSRRIDRKYVTYSVATRSGQVVTGLLMAESPTAITLRDAAGKDFEIARDQIEESVPQPKSLMPDLLLRDLTAEEVAHVLAYLTTLRQQP